MPSVAKNTIAAGLDLALTKTGFYAAITYYYSDPIPMNDANTDFASSHNLLGGRIGYKNILFRVHNHEHFWWGPIIYSISVIAWAMILTPPQAGIIMLHPAGIILRVFRFNGFIEEASSKK